MLIVGPPGGGKSALANALLNERVATLHPLQSELERPVLAARLAPGLGVAGDRVARVTVIDTPGLADAGGAAADAGRALGAALAGRPLDVLLYVDRLDGGRVDAGDVEVGGGKRFWVCAPRPTPAPTPPLHPPPPHPPPPRSCASTPPTWAPPCGTGPCSC